MAYTIISQNNTTTTLADENGNVITVPARVTLATSTDYTITKVNNNSVDLVDGNGKVIRGVPACVVLAGEGGGGGGSVDYSKTVQKSSTIPAASADNAGQVYLYTGATDANYTTNYIYKNVKSATYTGTVSFEAATLSGTTVTCSGDNFANFLTEAGADPTPIVSGTMTYEADATGWRLVGKDSNDNTVTTFIEYVEDYEDAGFVFTGTPQDGDVVAFTCTVEEASATYAWTRIDVQPSPVIPDPLPSQTGNAGKFLTTDGTDASWSDKPLVNNTTNTNSLSILGTTTTNNSNEVIIGSGAVGSTGSYNGSNVVIGKAAGSGGYNHNESVIIGTNTVGRNKSVIIGSAAWGLEHNCVAIGSGARAESQGAIQINASGSNATNADANTVKVANANGNYEIMSADGTVPHGRLTNAVVSNTVTIAVADWNGGTTCTKTISGLTATSVVWVAPDNASQSDYLTAGVYASAQTTDTITFTCTTTPTSALTVNVIYC